MSKDNFSARGGSRLKRDKLEVSGDETEEVDANCIVGQLDFFFLFVYYKPRYDLVKNLRKSVSLFHIGTSETCKSL